jgi:hypothetical protein
MITYKLICFVGSVPDLLIRFYPYSLPAIIIWILLAWPLYLFMVVNIAIFYIRIALYELLLKEGKYQPRSNSVIEKNRHRLIYGNKGLVHKMR